MPMAFPVGLVNIRSPFLMLFTGQRNLQQFTLSLKVFPAGHPVLPPVSFLAVLAGSRADLRGGLIPRSHLHFPPL